MKFKMQKKRIIALFVVAILTAMNCMPVLAASNVNMAGVNNGMLNSDYWLDDWERNTLLMNAGQIVALNQKNYAFAPTNLTELFLEPDVFDGDSLKSSLGGFKNPAKLYLNGQPVAASYYENIRRNILGAKTASLMQVQYGIIVNRTVMKDLPYADMLSDDPSDPEWDNLVSSAIFVNDPVLCYFTTADGKFTYVKSELCSGWIPTADVAICADKNSWYMNTHPAAFLVVTGDKIVTEASTANVSHSQVNLHMGTKLELLNTPGMVDGRLSFYNYVVALPERDANGNYIKSEALIPVSRDVNVGYLPLTSQNLLNQAFKSLGNRYGWGGSLDSQDCSSYIREVYSCFGLSLPRNTTWQALMRCRVVDVSSMTATEKEVFFKAYCPAGAIVQFPGHEMMYLGESNGDFYTINDVSSIAADLGNPSLSVVKARSVVVNGMKSTLRKNGSSWYDNVNKVIIPWMEP